jgi:hypothetical protein
MPPRAIPGNKKKTTTRSATTTLIMLFFPFLPTLLILSSLSATARPLGPLSSYQNTPRAASLSPPPHIPSQPYHSDLVLADRRSSFPPPHSSGPIDTTTRQSSKRFIMDADYASSSGPPAFLGKSSHKRADSLSDMIGTTEVGYGDIREELPPKSPAGLPSA